MPGSSTERANADPPVRLDRRLTADPDAVGQARRMVAEFAAAHGVAGDALEVVLLCISEAATNAVVHAFPDRRAGTLRLVATAAPDTLRVSVTDDGVGMRPRTDSPGLGLGLPTIAQLAATLDIREGPGSIGTEVRMDFAAPGVRGEEPAGVPGGRYEILAEVTRLVEGRSVPGQGIDRLVDVLVPDVADASAIDVVEEDGVPRRVAARITGPDGEAASRWLAGLHPRFDARRSATRASLEERRPRQVELTPAHIAAINRTPEDAERMTATGIRWWLVVPLIDAGRLLGLLHCGRRADRGAFSAPTEEFLATVGERAARGLAHTRLVGDLRRMRRHFERVLGALSEAVLLHDAEGRILLANPAAARLLAPGAAVRTLAALRPLVREDGSPLDPAELPGVQLLAGRPGPPLAARLVDRTTGEERRLLVRGERLDETIAMTAVEDVTDRPPSG